MPDDNTPHIAQGIARRLIPLRWPRSRKLIGHLDLDSGELVYQDKSGRVLDRVALPSVRSEKLTQGVE